MTYHEEQVAASLAGGYSATEQGEGYSAQCPTCLHWVQDMSAFPGGFCLACWECETLYDAPPTASQLAGMFSGSAVLA